MTHRAAGPLPHDLARSPTLGRPLSLAGLALLLALGCDDPQSTVTDAAPPDAAADRGPADAGDAGVEAPPDADTGPPPDMGPPALDPRFDPAVEGEDFYATPWPSDARLTAAGTPDLSAFPSDRAALDRIISEIEGRITGFATMPVIYIAFDDDIAPVPLPSPVESLDPAAPVQLVELGERCGRRIPVEASVRVEGDRFIPAQTLQIKNTVGTVLEPGVPYGLVLLDGFARPDGVAIRRPPAFADAWAGDGTRWAASLEPLRACAADAGLDPEAIALATVFTPHDPLAELRAMRDRVMDPTQVETRPPMEAAFDVAWSRRRLRLRTHSGLVEMPVFQDGTPPYVGRGGGFVLDDDGVPTIQRWEPVPFAIAWRELDDPPEPRPALVFIDGTGWSPWSHLHSGWLNDALNQGFVLFSFMPQFHGDRAGLSGGAETATFNFINPTAGRTNFTQQAVENSFFTRIIREQLVELPDLPPLDVGRLVYGGHSQGSLAGALTAAVERAYSAYVFNGLSAYLTLTILYREDLLDFELVVRGLLGVDSEMDLFTPPLHLMQLGSEVVDPHNFARHWRGTAHNPTGSHVFVINGFTDDTTTPRGMDHLTISADIPTFDPPGWEIDPFGVGVPPAVLPPVQGNAVAFDGRPLTLATYMDSHQGHFTVYRSGTLRRMTLGFWLDALAGEVPALVPDRELMCGDGQDGDGDGTVDCEDADCQGREPCLEVVCDDERDLDFDGLVDCDDPDCVDTAVCQEEDCGDGLDDDGDGLIDCDDPGCADREPCGESICDDREDGDGDGLVDCADDTCVGRRECLEYDCGDLRDNDRDGLVDCADDECLGALACPEPACDDGTDEDGNGLTDCADPRCFGEPACPKPAETLCDDGLDDDGDGLTDCADPDCALFAACRPEGICADGDLGSATGIAVFQGALEEEGRDAYPPGDCTRLGSGKDAPDLALRWTAPADGVYILSTLGSRADTVMVLYRDDCDPLGEFGCHDDQPGVRTSAIALQIEAGQSVVIGVASYQDDTTGPVVLHIYPRPEPPAAE